MAKNDVEQILVRLEGKPKEILHDLLDKGYFKTKNEVIRAGILQLEKEYLSKERGEQAIAKIRDYFEKNKRSFKEVSEALNALED